MLFLAHHSSGLAPALGNTSLGCWENISGSGACWPWFVLVWCCFFRPPPNFACFGGLFGIFMKMHSNWQLKEQYQHMRWVLYCKWFEIALNLIILCAVLSLSFFYSIHVSCSCRFLAHHSSSLSSALGNTSLGCWENISVNGACWTWLVFVWCCFFRPPQIVYFVMTPATSTSSLFLDQTARHTVITIAMTTVMTRAKK